MNALCIPAPQEGVEDLLVAAVVVASETPESKGGLGSKCTKDKDCAGGLFCDPKTKICTEGRGHSEWIVYYDSSPSAKRSAPRIRTVRPVVSAIPMESAQNR